MKTVKSPLSEIADDELLAALVPHATVKSMQEEYGPLRQFLANAYPEELERLKGIGPIKAKQLHYVFELAKRLYQANPEFQAPIQNPQDVFDRVADMQYLSQEEFRVLFLNTKNIVIAERAITRGTLNATVVSPREVFHRAVKVMAASVILVHNHPSGDPIPSFEDTELTRKMVEAGKVMDIAVLDHCIIGLGKFSSLKEKGLM